MIVWPLWVLDGAVWGPAILLLSEILAASQSGASDAVAPWTRPRLAVLIPAHNEAADIERTLQMLMPQMNPPDRLIVIADNCQDCTAEVARQAGALVIERSNLQQRGKGYALDYGVKFLSNDPPDIVVIVDADCEVAPGSVDALARQVQIGACPAQSTYLMNPPPQEGLRDQISRFAFTLKNLARPLGMKALGWPCLLTGSGMAFPWSLLQQVELAGSKTVDDMQLTIDFALQGTSPVYVPESRVMGRLMQHSSALSQRSRWEHGHMEVILTQVPRLLWAALVQRRWDLLILGLDLSIPPLSLLILLWLSLVGLQLAIYLLGRLPLPTLLLTAGAGMPLGLSLLIGWLKFGQDTLPLKAWIGIPQYFLWKVPIYARFLTQPQTRWLKTERDTVEHSEP
jgi:cellulose synthase/poly-beta-1,6-N-acetylglucosamine synthase-like glycosyltransferase